MNIFYEIECKHCKDKVKLKDSEVKGVIHFKTVEPICISDVRNVKEYVIVIKKKINVLLTQLSQSESTRKTLLKENVLFQYAH